MPAADFGSAPSGEVPILFNDHHVYSKPDELKQNRVLAALVRGGTILIPLRSMFEQMGATVSYDPATKTADVSKPGSDVKVTVGKSEVVINGESRPLDVPPEMYKGSIVVPVRVISEGMGAYVQWVPEKKTVVVRYVPAPVPTAPPTAAPTARPTTRPTAPPTAAPTPIATPTPVARLYEHFIVGDYMFSPKVYNELSPGNSRQGPSYAGRLAFEFPLGNLPFMFAVDARQYAYPHTGSLDGTVARNAVCAPGTLQSGNPGCVTTLGGGSNVYVPSFTAIDRDVDGRLGIQIARPRIYVAASYLVRNTNYGYPQQHGVGAGLEKLPDLDHPLSLFGSYYYYPQISGNFSDPNGTAFQLQYRYTKYQVGLDYHIPFNILSSSGVFLEGGYMGDNAVNKQFAPGNSKHAGFFAGLGLHF